MEQTCSNGLCFLGVGAALQVQVFEDRVDELWLRQHDGPGCVAVFVAFLSSPLTIHGRFVILPYWQAVQKGFLHVRRRWEVPSMLALGLLGSRG